MMSYTPLKGKPMEDTKECNTCKQVKGIAKFEWQKNRPNPRNTCIKCRQSARVFTPEQRKKRREKQKEWAIENKDKTRFDSIKRKYGLSKGGYDDLYRKQKGLCAICLKQFKGTKQTHVDHCHKTNKVRGLLCSKCNPAIGLFGDDVLTLSRAIDYINYPHFQLID